MHPDGNGRYCDSCAKTVIDFSIMTDKEIHQYFTDHWGENTCGRFKNTQLKRIIIYIPASTIQHQPYWKKFLVACLLVLGTSIFPFETTLALPQEHTELTESNKKCTQKKIRIAKKKKTKIRLNQKKFLEQIFTPGCIMIAGFIVIDRPPIIQAEVSIAPTDTQENTEKKVFRPSAAIPLNKNKKAPSSPAPYSSEFILPVMLSKKRRSRSKKKK
jgi:hypothetical protein